ncbi:MAG: helix-turn-helix domain-containing protein, partial [Bacteroidia bacterium]
KELLFYLLIIYSVIMTDSKTEAHKLLGNVVRKKRLEKGLTQEALGAELGYSSQTAKQVISQIERGAVWIPTKKVSDFIKVLNLDSIFYQKVNFLFAIGNYDEVFSLLKQRAEAELQGNDLVYGVELPAQENIEAETSKQTIVGGKDAPDELLEIIPETGGETQTGEMTVVLQDEASKEVESSQQPKNTDELVQKLVVLKKLLDMELVSREEYKAKREELIDRYL